jgi:hypothetical protein
MRILWRFAFGRVRCLPKCFRKWHGSRRQHRLWPNAVRCTSFSAYSGSGKLKGCTCQRSLVRLSLRLFDPLKPLGILEFIAFSKQGSDIVRCSWGERKVSLTGKEILVIAKKFLASFLSQPFVLAKVIPSEVPNHDARKSNGQLFEHANFP